MWIIDPLAGLVSVIASDVDENVLVCRSRTPGTLKKVFGEGTEEVILDGRDYAVRAYLPRSTVAAVIAERLLNVEYTNCKGAVDPKDHALHDAMLATWHAFAKTQPWPPYAKRTLRSKAGK
jgi:hypothetical protein